MSLIVQQSPVHTYLEWDHSFPVPVRFLPRLVILWTKSKYQSRGRSVNQFPPIRNTLFLSSRRPPSLTIRSSRLYKPFDPFQSHQVGGTLFIASYVPQTRILREGDHLICSGGCCSSFFPRSSFIDLFFFRGFCSCVGAPNCLLLFFETPPFSDAAFPPPVTVFRQGVRSTIT